MKKYYAHIWLDDCRMPEAPGMDKNLVYWVRGYDGFVTMVEGLKENIGKCKIYFDHDLGEEKDGYDCAKFLVNWCMENGYDVPDYSIQSANPVGRKNIESVFTTYEKVKNM